jgi:hypothetical protein
VNHNVHTASFTNNPLNTMLPPGGALNQKFVAERRPIPLTCDIHPWMKGWIMVFDHPFFAVTGADGSFEIQGVPPGTHNFVLRTGDFGFVTTGRDSGIPVKVAAGQVTDVGELKLVPQGTTAQ